MPSTSQSYHRTIKDALEAKFLSVLRRNIPNNILLSGENDPLIKDEKRMLMAPIYSPICDVAIGPFAFGEERLNYLYCDLAGLNEFNSFINRLQESSFGDGYNNRLLDLNENPRCFFAIEVERSTAQDTKHLLGSFMNCSLMGKIGIVVIFDDYVEHAGRLLQYLAFVKRVKKVNKELFRNVFVISKSIFDTLLQTSP